jgi:hypothetical protein
MAPSTVPLPQTVHTVVPSPVTALSPLPPPKRAKRMQPPVYSPGELGKLAMQYAHGLARLGWARFLRQHHHRRFPSTSPHLDALPHPAATLLHNLATNGVPAPSSAPPWSTTLQDAATSRGPHPSAARTYTHFLLEDMFDMVQMGYWLVLPFSAVRGHPHLKLAPSGVVPQRERRPRPIMDYSFNGVNQSSLPIAPMQAMQFGHCLQRVLQRIAYCNPLYGPPLLAKLDLADGYYRVPLSQEASLELAVVLPADGLAEPLIGLPLSLPMGWSFSPPYFCAFTETIADLSNHRGGHLTTDHPYRHIIQTCANTPSLPLTFDPAAILPYNPNLPASPIAYTDVYLDDFMVVAQPPRHLTTMNTLLQAVHSVFCDSSDSPRRVVVSQSKVEKGDATLSTTKRILGWDIDTRTMTIHLPPHRLDRLHELIQKFLTKKYTTRRQWQTLLGELRSMTLALHSSALLFSALQNLLRSDRRRMRIPALARAFLQDWMHMATAATSNPVPITSLVPHAPHYIGATDASKDGMGGWWVPTSLAQDTQPYVWRQAWPTNVARNIVSTKNRDGTYNNSELELAAAVLGHATLLQTTPVMPYKAVFQGIDNTAAQSWITRGNTPDSVAPALLLRALARDSRHYGSRLSAFYIPGVTNSLSDLLSRSFTLSDAELLEKIHAMAPSQQPWKFATPPEHWASNPSFWLSNKLPKMQSLLDNPGEPIQPGRRGRISAIPLTKTPGSSQSMIPRPSFRSSLIATEWDSWLPPDLLSKLERWKQPFVPWARRSPSWDSLTPGSKRPENWTSAYTANSSCTRSRIPHQLESNPYPYKSYNWQSNIVTNPIMLTRMPSLICSS